MTSRRVETAAEAIARLTRDVADLKWRFRGYGGGHEHQAPIAFIPKLRATVTDPALGTAGEAAGIYWPDQHGVHLLAYFRFDEYVPQDMPAVRSSSSGEGDAGNDTTISVTLPATIEGGDTIEVVISQDGIVDLGAGTSGFTLQRTDHHHPHDPTNVVIGFFVKKAAGTPGDPSPDAGTTVLFTGCAVLEYSYAAHAFEGAADPTERPPVVSSSSAEGVGTTATPPGCDTGEDPWPTYWLAGVAVDHDEVTGFPADMPLDHVEAGTDGLFNASVGVAGARSTASSFTPAGSFTLAGSRRWIAYTIGVFGAGEFTGTDPGQGAYYYVDPEADGLPAPAWPADPYWLAGTYPWAVGAHMVTGPDDYEPGIRRTGVSLWPTPERVAGWLDRETDYTGPGNPFDFEDRGELWLSTWYPTE